MQRPHLGSALPGTDATTHEKIFVARMNSVSNEKEQGSALERLYRAAEDSNKAEILAALQALVPTYTPGSDDE